ncbi:TonB-dependent receptor plug domain-containing protein [Sulfurimonas sp.]
MKIFTFGVLAFFIIIQSTIKADSDLDIMDSLSMEEMLELTISTSTGTDKPLSLAPAIATVITDKQIAQSSARTLDELLERVPGLNVYNAIGDLSGYFDIRGIRTKYNPQVMILMNGTTMQGLKFNNPVTGLNIPLTSVKRIEIMRGPGSVIYGANAFSGVINIITKDAQYLNGKSEAGVRYGSFNTKELWVNHGAIEEDFSYAINFSYMSSDGDDNRKMKKDFQTLNDNAFGSSASLAPGSLNTNYERYNLNANFVKDDFEFNFWLSLLDDGGTGTGIANALDNSGKTEYKRMHGDLYYHQKIDDELKLEHKIALSYQTLDTYLYVFPAGARLPIGTDGNFGGPFSGFVTFSDGYIGTPTETEKTSGYEATLMIESFENHQLRLSAGYWYGELDASASANFGPGIIDGTVSPIDGTLTDQTGSSSIYMPNVDRKKYFVSIQDEWSLKNNLILTAGVRYDHYSDVGSSVNPRLALVWQTSNALTSKLLYGRAFRAPSFVELYAQNNPVGNGNSNVEPETIDTYELAFDYYPNSKVRTSTNLYYYYAKNLIDAVGSSIGNVGQQKGHGLEFELNYQPNSTISINADYAYRYTKVVSTGQEVADAPKHLAHTGINWNFTKKWTADAELFWVGDRKRTPSDTRDRVPSYSIVNLSLTNQINKSLILNLSARNLFDKDIYNPSPASTLGELDDFQLPTRSIFAELRYRF